jgi:hypothetical protein
VSITSTTYCTSVVRKGHSGQMTAGTKFVRSALRCQNCPETRCASALRPGFAPCLSSVREYGVPVSQGSNVAVCVLTMFITAEHCATVSAVISIGDVSPASVSQRWASELGRPVAGFPRPRWPFRSSPIITMMKGLQTRCQDCQHYCTVIMCVKKGPPKTAVSPGR